MNGYGDEMEIDIGRVLSALWRRGWVIGVVSILCALLTLLGTFLFVTPKYQSTVMFCVSGQSPAKDCIVVLETGETLREVIEASGVSRDREALETMLSAEAVDAAAFFSVTVSSEDAGEARAIADAVARILPERVAGIVEGTTLNVADPPLTANRPGTPDYLKNTLVGALAGFAVTAGAIALREIFRGGENGKYEEKSPRAEKTGR